MSDVTPADARTEGLDGPFFRVRRLGHVNLFVGDLDASMRFYHDVIGLDVAWRRESIRSGFHSNGSSHHDIGLVDLHGPLGEVETPDLNHLAFELETQVDLVKGYRAALSAGFGFSAMYDHEISHSLYYRDPAGTLIEVYADTEVDWRTRHVSQTKTKLSSWVPGATPPSERRYYDPDPDFTRLPDAVFHAKRVTHAVLVTDRLEQLVQQYAHVLGMSIAFGSRREGLTSMSGTCGGRDVTFVEAGSGLEPGLHHFGFSTWDESDLSHSMARARALGWEVEEVDHPARRSAMLRDPDGFRAQIYVDRQPLKAAGDAVDRGTLLHLV